MLARLIVIIPFLLFSCTKEEEKFSLKGKTNLVEDGSYLYVHDMVNNKTLDSALVADGNFKFTNPKPQYPLWTMLHSADRSKFREIWIEDKAMTFTAIDTLFNAAVVTGSVTDSLAGTLYNNVDFRKE